MSGVPALLALHWRVSLLIAKRGVFLFYSLRPVACALVDRNRTLTPEHPMDQSMLMLNL